MGSLRKRGKTYYIDYRVNGKRIKKAVGQSKRLAELKLKEIEVNLEKEELGFARPEVSITNFVNEYLEHSEATHRARTTLRYKSVLYHFLEFAETQPGLKKLSQITPKTIDQYRVYRRNAFVNPNGERIADESEKKKHTRTGARANTINFEINALRTALYVAVKWGYLQDNPVKMVKKLKVDDATPPRFLTENECQALLDACPPNLYPAFFTFLHTGMRKGELENLMWTDIDFRRRKILITKKDDWNPKTEEREIPMSDAIFKLLSDMQNKVKKGEKAGYVFAGRSGKKSGLHLREKLIQIAKKAGIENLTKIHTLRHTFASHLVMRGVDLPTVQKLMGHTDIKTTMIYAHLAPDHLSDAVNKLNFR